MNHRWPEHPEVHLPQRQRHFDDLIDLRRPFGDLLRTGIVGDVPLERPKAAGIRKGGVALA